MIDNANKDLVQMSDIAIIQHIGNFIRHQRLQKNLTQAHLAEMAGLNRWTLSQIENGEAITLMSLIQILRALDSLYVLNQFEVSEELSPLEYAKLKRKQKKRVRQKKGGSIENNDQEW